MTRTYATPLAFKAAVEQRLRNEAVQSGLDLRRLRQLLVFDRYLARVFAVLKGAVVLKGGLVIELRLARARTTRDIDLRLVGSPGDVLPRLQEAGRLDLGDYLTFEVQRDPNHPEIDAEATSLRSPASSPPRSASTRWRRTSPRSCTPTRCRGLGPTRA